MLSDAPFTSPWSPEVLLTGDFKLPVVCDGDDDEDILDLYRSHQYKYDDGVDNHSCLGSTSGTSSVTTSSNCSADFDADDDTFTFGIETSSCIQDLDADFIDIIDASVVNDNLVYSNVSSAAEESDNSSPTTVSIPEASHAFTCSTRPLSSTCSTCRSKKTCCKKWGHLTKSEKAKLVDELSLTISRDLELREQMDIIKIINPTASFDKQPSEFVIDLKSIDERKLEKIQDIVHFRCVHSPDIIDNHRIQDKKFSKKNRSYDRKPRVAKQRMQKEYRQKLKEKRSGLFVKEERLAVSTTIMEEEIDIVG